LEELVKSEEGGGEEEEVAVLFCIFFVFSQSKSKINFLKVLIYQSLRDGYLYIQKRKLCSFLHEANRIFMLPP
jgi:hypothetical protein